MANNPLKTVYLSAAQLQTMANGGSVTSGSDTYTADLDAIYMVPDEGSTALYLHELTVSINSGSTYLYLNIINNNPLEWDTVSDIITMLETMVVGRLIDYDTATTYLITAVNTAQSPNSIDIYTDSSTYHTLIMSEITNISEVITQL